jgi:hypothetical protein
MDLGVKIKRDVVVPSSAFIELFQGFEKVDAVRSIFGDKTEEVLSDTKVVLSPRRGYCHVDDSTGSIVISSPYLKTGDERYIYLDLIHELVHVKQLKEGMELFDKRFSYVDSPTEIEAHIIAVQEARRIGMNDEELADYLRVDWISEEEYVRLLRTLGVRRRIVS